MIDSNNEWGQLESVVVGSATNAHWPRKCSVFRNLENTTRWKKTPVPSGNVSSRIIQETNEDLENFCKVLNKLNIKTHRPMDLDFSSFDGMYNYCPRDRVLVIGNKIIDAPMTFPTRKKEIEALHHILPNELIICDDPTAKFDAANICRLDRDILYLVSDSGNERGGYWLQEILGKEYNVHMLTNIYNGIHIDSTICPIKEGMVVLNSDRINENNIPKIFESWEKIYISGDEIVPQSFINYPYASKYIGLNFLTINPQLIICDPHQEYIRKKLNTFGIESIGVNIRHSRTLGGGHHCVTLDLKRK